MPTFRFQGVDASGRPVEGDLDGATQDDAVRALSQRGVRLRSLELAALPASAQTPAPAAAPGARQPLSVADPRGVLAWRPFRTRPASHADLAFLFGQAARLLNAGISPARALHGLMPGHPSRRLRQAVDAMGAAASQGGRLSAAMARFPDVFGPEAAAAVEAGELGGYLPEAFSMLAAQEEEARKLAWKIRIPRWALVALSFGALISVSWTAASRQFIDRALNDPSATAADNLRFLFSQAFRHLFGPYGLLVLGVVAGYAALAVWAKRPGQRLLRHSLVARFPLGGRYSRESSLAVFTDHLGRLSAAGIPPATAWPVAARTCPNLACAQELLAAGMPSESATMGDLVARTGLMGPELRQLVATGEMTGTLPDAMAQASRMARANREHAQAGLGLAWYGAMLALAAAVVTLAVASFYTNWYGQMFRSTLDDVYGDSSGP